MPKSVTENSTQEVKAQSVVSETMNTTENKAKGKQTESKYTIEELAANAEELFNTRPECVIAALREKEITECTKEKAERIVKEFNIREVK